MYTKYILTTVHSEGKNQTHNQNKTNQPQKTQQH